VFQEFHLEAYLIWLCFSFSFVNRSLACTSKPSRRIFVALQLEDCYTRDLPLDGSGKAKVLFCLRAWGMGFGLEQLDVDLRRSSISSLLDFRCGIQIETIS